MFALLTQEACLPIFRRRGLIHKLHMLLSDVWCQVISQVLRLYVTTSDLNLWNNASQTCSSRCPKQGGDYVLNYPQYFAVIAHNTEQRFTSTFLSTVHLLPKGLRFERGDARLASCPVRCLTSLRSCRGAKYILRGGGSILSFSLYV